MSDYTPTFIPNHESMCYYDSVLHLLFSIPEVRHTIDTTNIGDIDKIDIKHIINKKIKINGTSCENETDVKEIKRRYKDFLTKLKLFYEQYTKIPRDGPLEVGKIYTDNEADAFKILELIPIVKSLSDLVDTGKCLLERDIDPENKENDAIEIMNNITTLLQLFNSDLDMNLYQHFGDIASPISIDTLMKYIIFTANYDLSEKDIQIPPQTLDFVDLAGDISTYIHKGLIFFKNNHYVTLLREDGDKYISLDGIPRDGKGFREEVIRSNNGRDYGSRYITDHPKSFPIIHLYERVDIPMDTAIPSEHTVPIAGPAEPTGINPAIIPTVISAVATAAVASNGKEVSPSSSSEESPSSPKEPHVILTQPALEKTLFSMIMDLLNNTDNTTSFNINAYDESGKIKEYTVALIDNQLKATLKSPFE